MSARLHTVAPAQAGAGQPHVANAGHTNAATPAFAGVTGIQ
ncbi:hypothetical protein ACVWYO_003329 [Sphingomonas sp. UYP23]